jgi:hypothetical protein
MARRNRRRPAPSPRTALGTLIAGVALLSTLGAEAPAGERPLPALNLARGQAIQLNVSLLPPSLVRPEACEAVLGFVDGAGRPLVDREGMPIERRVALVPGATESLRLPPSAVFGDGRELRALFRATVRLAVPPEPITPDPCEGAAVSVEIFDVLTGRTTFGLGALPPSPVTPQP